jgi:hypothetical protein
MASESPVELALRLIGIAFADDGDWGEKYGANYENDVFLMHRFCWCDNNDGSCLWCLHGDHPDFDRLLNERFGTKDYQEHRIRGYYDPPNFWFKPSDFRVRWYKYIGRDMASNKDEVPGDFLQRIFETHPAGMTIEAAMKKYQTDSDARAQEFADMMASLTFTPPKEAS